MRVITGSARGRKLKTLDSLDIRPTADAVKEAMFSIIQFQLVGASVLDLFAGSGQLGIEALSRGAAHCVFVDNSAASVAVVKDNVNACRFNDRSRILHMDSVEYLKVAKNGIDIALLDPPYRKGLLETVLPALEKKLSSDACVVCEHENELVLPDEVGRLARHKRYKYGRIALSVYKMRQEPDEADL